MYVQNAFIKSNDKYALVSLAIPAKNNRLFAMYSAVRLHMNYLCMYLTDPRGTLIAYKSRSDWIIESHWELSIDL